MATLCRRNNFAAIAINDRQSSALRGEFFCAMQLAAS
jgi:hypothetical protein